jgi:hypothetical protein
LLIGIVSKDAHIKVHAKALREEGFSVLGLGSSPTEIPPTVDLLVLRTQSCSHGGSNTAYSWNRATKKPLIVENGLSGIRAKLQALIKSKNQTKQEEPLMKNFRPFSSAVFPKIKPESTLPWDSRAVPLLRLERAYNEALEVFRKFSEQDVLDLHQDITCEYPAARIPRSLEDVVSGRPLVFFFLVLWSVPKSVRGTLNPNYLLKLYRNFSGSASNRTYVLAASWVAQNQEESFAQPVVSATPSFELEDSVVDEVSLRSVEDKFFNGLCSSLVLEKLEAGCDQDLQPQGSKTLEVKPQDLEAITGGLASLRGDVEQFLLEVSTSNQELLRLVKELRQEVTALREEVVYLKGTQPTLDPLTAILNLRDAGAEVTINFGKI